MYHFWQGSKSGTDDQVAKETDRTEEPAGTEKAAGNSSGSAARWGGLQLTPGECSGADSKPAASQTPEEKLDKLLQAFQNKTPEVWAKAIPDLAPIDPQEYPRAVAAILQEIKEEGWHAGFHLVISKLAIPVGEFDTAEARQVGRDALKGLMAAFPKDISDEHTTIIRSELDAVRQVFDLTPADERALGIELIRTNIRKGKLLAAGAIAKLLNITAPDLVGNPIARAIIPFANQATRLFKRLLSLKGGPDNSGIGRGRLRYEAVLAGDNYQAAQYPIKYHKQYRSFSCGAASMRMVLETLYNMPVSEEEALRLIGTTAQDGTPLKNLDKIEDEFPDLDAVVGEHGTPQELTRLLDQGYLIVVNYSPKGPHYAVLSGVGDKGITLCDPWLGPTTSMSVELFNSIWKGGYRRTKITEKGYVALRRKPA